MTAFHHGISAQELTQGIMPMRNANVSVIGLVVTSTDADDIMYPSDTPVLLTGITQDNIDNAGTNGTLRDCLQAIRDIHNPTIVILRMSEPLDVDTLDVLLTCPSRFGLMPKRLGAPEIDTPDVVLKLVSIAKKRRGIVYASPRTADGALITDKAAIVTYRDSYGDRELCLIDGEWGMPEKSNPSDGSGGDFNPIVCTPTSADFAPDYQPLFSGTVHARYRVNNGKWIDYEAEVGVDTPKQVIERFVTSIQDTSGKKLVATSLDSESTPTPFYCPGGEHAIYSGADPESPLVSFAQMSFDSPLATKLDFAMTATRPNDLVAAMFNSDQTIISCGLAFWAYR